MHARQNARFPAFLQAVLSVVLAGLASVAPVLAQTTKCDVNGDGQINQTDLTLIIAALNRPATGPGDPRDPDNSGVINALDVRTCQQRCTLTGCALPPSNTAPVANNDSYGTPEDTTLVVMAPGVLGNDTDAQNNALTAALVSGPASGTLVLSPNGSFSYMPAPNFSGPVTFTYRANDGSLNSNIATVTLDVVPVNDGPVAQPDNYTTGEDTALTVAAPGVLGNDIDPDANPLTAQLVSGTAANAGTLTLNGNGSFTFTPAANFTGVATFSYVASDGTLSSGVTTVTINVTPVADAPVANADSYGTDEDVTLTVAAPGVLGNDTDADGGALTAVLDTPPASGTLVLNSDGSFTYTPAPGASGPAGFTYRASDGLLTSNAASVSITVLPVNDAPVAAHDSYSTSANTPLSVAAPGVLANDTDQEGSGLTAVLSTGPTNGALNLNANGGFTYTPNAAFSGTDAFTYRANDGNFDSNVATVTIVVSGQTLTLSVQDPFISVGGTTVGTVTLSSPSVGGTQTTLSVSDPLVASTPSSPFVPDGQTTATFTITGHRLGTATFNLAAPGYGSASVGVTVTANVITVGNVTVPPGSQAQFPVTLAVPAPAGGLTVNLTTLDPSIAAVPASVFIPAGQSLANPNPMVTGVGKGTTTIRGTAPNWAPGAGTATVAIAASFTPNPVSVVAGETAQTTLTLAQPAPAGGITVELTTANPSTATANSPVTIPAGQSSAAVTIVGVQMGSTTLTATGTGLVTASATVAVTRPPALTIADITLGKDLQASLGFGLGAPAPAGNLAVTSTSSDPTKLLGAPDATTAGAGSITVTVAAGNSSGGFNLQALGSSGTVSVSVSAPGYEGAANTTTLNPSGFYIQGNNVNTNTLDTNTNLMVCVARLHPTTLARQGNPGTLRFGISPVSVSLTSSNTAVGLIVGSPQSIPGNESCSVQGAFQFDPVGAGTSTVAMGPTPAGFSTPSTQQSIVATVTASGITMGSGTVGKNLQVVASGNTLQSPAPVGGTVVTLTSTDPTRLLLAPNATAAGMGSITVNVAQGGTGFNYYVQGLGETGTVQVTASAPGFVDGIATITLVPSGFYLAIPGGQAAGNFSTNTLDPNTNLAVCVARLNPATLEYQGPGTLRFGISPVSVGLTSSNTAVGSIVGSPQSIAGNASCSVTGALQFDPVGAGTSTVAIGPTPAGFSTPNNLQSIVATVTASGITLPAGTVGKNLQAATPSGTALQSPAPAGGTVVTLTSADPTRLLLAPNATTAGTGSITVNVAQGGTSFSYFVQGLDNTGTVQVTASAPGFADGTGTVTLVPSGFYLATATGGQVAVNFSTNTLDPNTNLAVCVARLNPATLDYGGPGTLRSGITPVSVSLTSSNTAVGLIVGSPSIAGNASCTGTGALQFDPVGAGTSTVAMGPTPAGFSTPSNSQSIVATVTASGITLPAGTVGKNLQVAAPSGTALQSPAPAGGITVTLTSADPTRLLLAPNATTAGTASITVNVAQGATSFNYFVQGLDNIGTVQVTASAPGFVNGSSTVTLAPSGFVINSPSGINSSATGANVNLQLCAARLDPATLNRQGPGTLRFGIGPVSVGATSSNAAAGVILNSPASVAGNVSCTATGAAGVNFDPIAPGVTTISIVPPAGFTVPSNLQQITATVN